MTRIDEHARSVKELEEDIKEKIRAKNLFERQKIIGFDVSEAATNLFEMYLHKKNLITEGFNVNHRFFSSMKRAEEKFKFDFPGKQSILEYLVRIEELTTKLCYGKSKRLEDVEMAIKLFFELKELLVEQSNTGGF